VSESKTDNKAQLGCGTLIIIALIVMFFSGGRESKELRKSVDELNAKVQRLEQKIDDLSKTIVEQSPAPRTADTRK
jgi:cell division protein FtsL